MTANKENPAAQGDAGRARFSFVSLPAMNDAEGNIPKLPLQLAFIARRVGALDPAILAALAALIFEGAAR